MQRSEPLRKALLSRSKRLAWRQKRSPSPNGASERGANRSGSQSAVWRFFAGLVIISVLTKPRPAVGGLKGIDLR